MNEAPTPVRLLPMSEVKLRVGLSKSTIYDWIAAGEFPRQVQLGGTQVRWVEAEIEAWIAARIEARDKAA